MSPSRLRLPWAAPSAGALRRLPGALTAVPELEGRIPLHVWVSLSPVPQGRAGSLARPAAAGRLPLGMQDRRAVGSRRRLAGSVSRAGTPREAPSLVLSLTASHPSSGVPSRRGLSAPQRGVRPGGKRRRFCEGIRG